MVGETVTHYRILDKLGGGGMGLVYRAEDVKLGRTVALKFLSEDLAQDPQALERFQREARAASALDHPNICTIYEIGEHDGQPFIVMQLLEGQTLKHRISGKALPTEEILELSVQISAGLERAYSKGIIHRDIKPANIFVTREQQAKILDFGLAKLASAQSLKEAAQVSALPTADVGEAHLTSPGAALGTVAYMSPEQALGKEIDARSDLFSLGVVLYEMATGTLPFKGSTAAAMFDSIFHKAPISPTRLNPELPAELERIINKALEKDCELRYQTAAELRADLKRLKRDADSSRTGVTITVPPAVPKKSSLALFVIPAAVLIAAIAYGYYWLRNREDKITIVRTRQLTFASGPELDPAVSPDGKMFAYVAPNPDGMHVFVRQIATGDAIDITKGLGGNHRRPQWSPDGTRVVFATNLPSGSSYIYVVPNLGGIPKKLIESSDLPVLSPAWSPSGDRIAYTRGGEVYCRPLDGGDSQRIADAFEPHSLNWSSDGNWIAFVTGNYEFISYGNIAPSSIQVVRATGGVPVQITDNNTQLNISPIWLPDSKSLLFISDRDGNRDVYRASIGDSGARVQLPTRLTTGLNAQTISLSKDGKTLVYSVFNTRANIWSARISDKGPLSFADARPVTSGNESIEGISVSPDESWILFDSSRSGNQDIYKMPRAGGEAEQLTTHPADDFLPVWSRDGKWIAFYSFRKGNRDLYTMSSDGGSLQQITSDPAQERYPDWSPDSKRLVFQSDKSGSHELFIISKDDSGTWSQPRQITSTGAGKPRWSPEGTWIAYVLGGVVRLISPDGGEPKVLVPRQPSARAYFTAWSRDGSTLFYKASDPENRATIWSIPVAGGTSTLLLRLDDPLRSSLRPEFTVDNHDMFFTITERESDIWVMELGGQP